MVASFPQKGLRREWEVRLPDLPKVWRTKSETPSLGRGLVVCFALKLHGRHCWKIMMPGVELEFLVQTNFVALMTMQVLLGFPLSLEEKEP